MKFAEQTRLVFIVAALGANSGCSGAATSQPVVVVDLSPEAEPSKASPTNRGTLLGHWEGTGHQSTGSSWAMEVELSSLVAGKCGSARYPSLSCGAEWICVAPSDGQTLRAREQITEGRTLCLDGQVEMSLKPNGELVWHWTGLDDGEEETANARLHRSD